MGEAAAGRANVANVANVVNLAFRPENEFLLPYVAAAGTLPGLSDEFMDQKRSFLRVALDMVTISEISAKWMSKTSS